MALFSCTIYIALGVHACKSLEGNPLHTQSSALDHLSIPKCNLNRLQLGVGKNGITAKCTKVFVEEIHGLQVQHISE